MLRHLLPRLPLVVALLLAAPLAAQTTVRVSVDSAGSQGNGISDQPVLSADGRFVVFSSFANNLVPGDTNSAQDVFVRDLVTGTTEIVSVDSNGVQGLWSSSHPSISADGRYVCFQSDSETLVIGDTNGYRDCFVHDRLTGFTERVNVDSNGAQADGWVDTSAISADGRYVAFQCYATNLVAGDTNGLPDVFVRDRVALETVRVSVDSAGVEGDGRCYRPAISADGRFVLFESDSTNLVAGDTNGLQDLFVHDRLNGTTERVNLNSLGGQANDYSQFGAISTDGRFVAFVSWASNLVAGDTNLFVDVFLRDRLSGTSERVSLSAGGGQGDNDSGTTPPSLSADGRFVVFDSLATNLVAGDTNWVEDLFLRDRLAGTTTRVSLADKEFKRRFGLGWRVSGARVGRSESCLGPDRGRFIGRGVLRVAVEAVFLATRRTEDESLARGRDSGIELRRGIRLTGGKETDRGREVLSVAGSEVVCFRDAGTRGCHG